MPKGTILMVEDQAGFRRIYHDMLEKEGYEVWEAQDREEGLEMVKSRKPHLVLLDLGLPKIDGFEVLKRIRADADTAQMPVIIFSVLGDPKDVKKGQEMGANDYTVKGFYTPRQVLSKIKNLMNQVEVKAPAPSYQLRIQETAGDAPRLQGDIGLAKTFHCPACGQDMVLEAFPDYARGEGHWFTARFLCSKCGKVF